VGFILLAAYLKLVPVELVRAYQRPILEGKSCYGLKVDKTVILSGVRYITVCICQYYLLSK
jgi:phosphoribosylglycinamide formyltransferase